MDFLTRHRTRLLWLAMTALLGLVPVACLIWSPSETATRFSHRVHVVERQLECVFCHSRSESAANAGMPGPQLCAPCHDEFDGDKPEDRRLAAYFDDKARFLTTPVASLPDDVRFSHRLHVREHDVACSDCHADIAHSDGIPAPTGVSKAGCMDCHEQRDARNDCAACHEVIDRSWVPPSHSGRWDLEHGPASRFADATFVKSANRCDLCHQEETDCQTCHQESAPRDHTPFWRLRGHGVAVSIDRHRCQVCHRPDTCVRCHQSTPPISHTAGFGGSRSRHCAGCHFPLERTGCATCHEGTPSHELAAPLPPGHTPAMNCRQCHGLTAPLPHFDGGQPCTVCHR